MQSGLEHRPVFLSHDLGSHDDSIVGAYAEIVAVLRGMVNLAEGESVADDRLTRFGTVWRDMSSIEQVGVP